MRKSALVEEFRVSEPFNLEPPIQRSILQDAEGELRRAASQQEHGCWGYYPGSEETAEKLPKSRAFAEAWPVIKRKGRTFTFDWMKFSQGSLESSEGYHLDRSRATGLGSGELDDQLVPRARIWRIIANLHAADRHLSFLNVDAHAIRWQEDEHSGFITPAEEAASLRDFATELVIPRRQPWRLAMPIAVSAVEMCVSRVAHGARETQMGHFLASWSYQEPEEQAEAA